MVFLQHYAPISWGWTGVDIFFALSGFLITGILFQTQDRPHRFRTFYIRRVLRIFPLYYGVFAVLLLLTPVLHFQWNRFWLFWVFHVGNYLRSCSPLMFAGTAGWVPYAILASRFPWLYVNAGHFWSLCIEEQFYLLWPFVVFTVRRTRPLLAICLTYFVLVLLMRVWIMHWHMAPEKLFGLMAWTMPLRADALLLGGALALWLHLSSGARAVQSRARVSPVFAVALGTVAVWLLTHHDLHLPPNGNLLNFPIVDLGAVCLVFEALRPRSLLSVLLSWKPLRQAGKLTYGAYVFHDLPHTLYSRVAQHLFRAASPVALTVATACIGLGCTMILAWLSFHSYEAYFLKWKDRLAKE